MVACGEPATGVKPCGGEPERVAKFLSTHGLVSRRGADEMIRTGRVTVNGLPAELGQKARYGTDDIKVDGVPLNPETGRVYIMLNKPRGYVTTMNDERGRKTVMSLVAALPARVYPVGRLDINSEGLLLMTNDGDFANVVAHPSFEKEKKYEVHVYGDAAGAVQSLSLPMEIDNRLIQARSVKLVKAEPDGGIIQVTVGEGRNRQIRNMCSMCGLKVLSLRRISIGGLELGSLKTGQWRYLTEYEVRLFG